ncbi:zinc finger CHY domain-containing protein [Setomelanomma holmii]|uniref:Zinc finger CHY domain-containing protein n=1 Tax=Setomelanomma holmii TaxID=210430 RepID=A0A9P4LG88_9PLEO|nr:zinc finger CHY domain-containing protein [Setomelanomma holmii]
MANDASAASPSPQVHGISVSPLTQCAHWNSLLDIIAIKHFCCNKFYACISCHDECESHCSGVWPRSRRDEKAVLCGACKHILTVDEYMDSGSRCTSCKSGFNPGCENHWGLYFEMDDAGAGKV